MVKQKIVKRPLPLLEELEQVKTPGLMASAESNFILPEYIKANLKHELRPYQVEAIFNLNWAQRQPDANLKYKQLLFNMATGSGKTDVMAAVMLYLFKEFNNHNFLFVANTNAVVAKTRENFLNENSTKYLFKAPIDIEGQRVSIQPVTRYPLTPTPGVIYLKLTTIQSLANEMGNTHENGLTYEELSRQKLVILADEAHHFNASTKSKKDEEQSWENLLNKLRQLSPANRQFEFTATIDLQKDEVYQKYRDKIIYKYELDKFMNEGYSKKVFRLETSSDDRTKMLNAILLSQYRRRIALANQIDDGNFKPIILFKSNRVAASNQARDKFVDLIEQLTVEQLDDFLATQLRLTKSVTLEKTYRYWQSQDVSQTVVELKHDFQPLTIVNVNDTAKDGILGDINDFNNLNSLEDSNNPIRTIFAVAKLTEGWDVLNLYDIVRLGEQPANMKQTDSEAQLIGRGARYNPFIYKNKKSYTRRFDNVYEGSILKDLQLLESLYYHTINDVAYINNLRKSFDKMNLVSESDSSDDFTIYTATVKPKFKKSRAYKQGQLYFNEVEDIPATDYTDLGSYGFNHDVDVVDYINASTENAYDQNNQLKIETRQVQVDDFSQTNDNRLLKKAIAKDKFFRFSELSKYLPLLNSMNEFLTSKKWLGGLKVRANIDLNRGPLSQQEKLIIVEKTLQKVKRAITTNYQKRRGTNRFVPMALHDVVVDYQKRVSNNFTGNMLIQEKIQPNDMKRFDWFVYDTAIVDGLEKSLIDLISNFVEQLKQKYQEVYLIRNEETISKLSLHEFDSKVSVKHYQGFLPDFLLYLNQEQSIYQIYLEPKGDQLLERDQWKEDLLQSIRPDKIEVIGENNQVKLYGMKFYTAGDKRQVEHEFQDLGFID